MMRHSLIRRPTSLLSSRPVRKWIPPAYHPQTIPIALRFNSTKVQKEHTPAATAKAQLSSDARMIQPDVAIERGKDTSGGKLPFTPNSDQRKVLTKLGEGTNLIVEAPAGAGKTSTILALALEYPHLKFLVLMYNHGLAAETRDRAKSWGIKKMEIRTVHSLGVQCYTQECCRDEGLKRVVQDNMEPSISQPSRRQFDVVVIDECQDLHPCMKVFLDKFFRDFQLQQCQMVVVGDPWQCIYQYKDSDARFLTLASKPEVFGYFSSHPWQIIKLSTTNRLTPQNAEFLNEVVIKDKGTGGYVSARSRVDLQGKEYPRPALYSLCPYEDTFDLYKDLFGVGDTPRVAPNDIMIIAPSLKGNRAPVHAFANLLVRHKVPVYVPPNDTEPISKNLAAGKVLLCTQHHSKGLERANVIVFGMDSTYYKYYDRNPVSMKYANNAMYVAVSRPTERLIMLRDYREPLLPFMDTDKLPSYCNHVNLRPSATVREKEQKKEIPYAFEVTTLVQNAPENIFSSCLQHLRLKEIVPAGIPESRDGDGVITDTFGLTEHVSDITGAAGATLHQMSQKRGFSLLWTVRENLAALMAIKKQGRLPRGLDILPKHEKHFYEILTRWTKKKIVNTSDVLFVAAVHTALIGGFNYKLTTIPDDTYDWLTEEAVDDICRTISEHIPTGSRVEYKQQNSRLLTVPLSVSFGRGSGPMGHRCTIYSIPDIGIVEEKGKRIINCNDSGLLSGTDVLKTAIYGGLNAASIEDPFQSLLLSTRTGQAVEVSPKTKDSFMKILQILITDYMIRNTGLFSQNIPSKLTLSDLTDEEFLVANRDGFRGRIGAVSLPKWFLRNPTTSKVKLRIARMRKRKEEQTKTG